MYFCDVPEDIISVIGTWAGIVGTLASVLLSVVAMIYSNESSKSAEQSLNEVTNYYKAFYEMIRDEKISQNLGIHGIDNIIDDASQSHTKL